MVRWPSALAAAAVLAAAGAGSASSQADCGRSVLRAWSTGTLAQTSFPQACYRAALQNLPADVAGYSSAADDIQRALLRRLRTSAGPTRRLASAAHPVAAPAQPQRLAAIVGGALIVALGAAIMVVNVHRRRRARARQAGRQETRRS